ncbi:MAG: ASCH domain-containing protein [Flavobacteriaceae bacterium]
MKQITLILFMILVGCKNETIIKSGISTETKSETETENGIDRSVPEMWNAYIQSNPEFKDEDIPEADYFHTNREEANRLAKLTLNGKKKASSGLYWLYKYYKVDLPKVGAKQIITDFDGKAQAIIKNISVDTVPFNKISKAYAEMDMGTANDPLKKWKKAHWDFFMTAMQESGEKPTEEMLIVCVRFETIWPEK